MGFVEEVKTGNFSLYGHLLGLLSGVLLVVLSAVTFIAHLLYSILGIVFGTICIIIEIPLLLKICPTGPTVDSMFGGLKNHWWRFVAYLVFAIVMWSSLAKSGGVLVIGAATVTLAALCYLIAAVKKQSKVTMSVLGGTGARSANGIPNSQFVPI
ncbi:Golgi apparatus membrane protein tvp18 [Coemansia sp. RSA 2049]|nr:Golgi apparatus membrane protein tvp18 [Coemansia sp. Benny D160-2]KAJ2515280.1 Golgi apparatus membrane protein tvp18 [Coemansia sp. RSA 1939]KAJ2523286.1 Golgi apparatus membrane protein tvp18 [Coemansia sp. RSA 2049]KAJ2601812.1 Golgi apparatus membrane protein tvp18 [Coemansia sp. RSA 1804]KAJ2691942.1 Golgi apparatus membrane protein tvp18 [Coemansia sp. RSA 1285]